MNNGKKNILIADDEAGVRSSFSMMLKDSYNIITAENGTECLRIVRQKQPQLVILDVKLPDMNGIDVLKEIKQINRRLPVIVVSGIATHRTTIEALKLGADDFIAKPPNFHYVRATIAQSLSNRSKNRGAPPSAEEIMDKSCLSSLEMLNKILEAKDTYTRRHSKKVSEYAVKIADELGLPADEQEVMRQTALLHDIGKVGIGEDILNKKTKLTPQEWEKIKQHVQIGEGFLEPFKLLHIEQSMVRHHHERYDGKGYPDELKGKDIPLYARILTVADAYEAMTSTRSYRPALSPIQALAELERCSGTQFDPEIVMVFVRILKKNKKITCCF